MQYLGFYWGVSTHPLTVSYQIMRRRIQEYGSLGVILIKYKGMEVVFTDSS